MARVLSLQSHVVSGYVGNKAATFPLQLLGFDVDAINTVQFSNHTGYPQFRGERLQGEQLEQLFEGLRLNDLLQYTHILTGYIGSASFLKILANIVRELKQHNPNLVYVCDPVMGDAGRLYVAPELVPLFKTELLPLADIVTPNQFELEQLSGRTILNETDALEGINMIHLCGPRSVVMTSSDFVTNTGQITLIGSRQAIDSREQFQILIPRLSHSFTGSGDLTSALLLAWTWIHPNSLSQACEKVVASIQSVLHLTLAAAQQQQIHAENDESKSHRLKRHELRLIQSKTAIESPVVQLKAIPL